MWDRCSICVSLIICSMSATNRPPPPHPRLANSPLPRPLGPALSHPALYTLSLSLSRINKLRSTGERCLGSDRNYSTIPLPATRRVYCSQNIHHRDMPSVRRDSRMTGLNPQQFLLTNSRFVCRASVIYALSRAHLYYSAMRVYVT